MKNEICSQREVSNEQFMRYIFADAYAYVILHLLCFKIYRFNHSGMHFEIMH